MKMRDTELQQKLDMTEQEKMLKDEEIKWLKEQLKTSRTQLDDNPNYDICYNSSDNDDGGNDINYDSEVSNDNVNISN